MGRMRHGRSYQAAAFPTPLLPPSESIIPPKLGLHRHLIPLTGCSMDALWLQRSMAGASPVQRHPCPCQARGALESSRSAPAAWRMLLPHPAKEWGGGGREGIQKRGGSGAAAPGINFREQLVRPLSMSRVPLPPSCWESKWVEREKHCGGRDSWCWSANCPPH